MKRVNWPRPPLLLGLVLGGLLERYMFISFQRYGADWLSRPIVIGVLLITAYSILKPFISDLLKHRQKKSSQLILAFKPHSIDSGFWFNLIVITFFVITIAGSWQWDFGARLVPQVVGSLGLFLASWQLTATLFINEPRQSSDIDKIGTNNADTPSGLNNLPKNKIGYLTIRYFSWCFFNLAAALVIGLLPAILIFLAGYLRIEAKENWKTTLTVSLGAWSISYMLFHQLLRVPWPASFIGDFFPGLRASGLTNFF
tara:strand:- start:265 stop:1032 length:768 start_codon:yes stop_codon:yes gene_type:complete